MAGRDRALALATRLARINEGLGRGLCWLIPLMALSVCAIVVLRALFNVGSIAAQESVTYQHALLFMLCLGYTLKADGHVRVDIFYRRFDPLQRAWVNALGALLLLMPLALFMIGVSWQFTLEAWRIREGSINPGGIPALFLLKTLIPLAGLLLLVQGLSEFIRNLLQILYTDATHS